jgi:thiamine-phosphate pyrophosphorylase
VKKILDFRLYLVTDQGLSLGRPLEWIVEAAVHGGVSAVQLREKSCLIPEYVEIARRIQKVIQPFGVPLIINDIVDVALAVGAAGVHLGQGDMPPREARKLLGPDAVIGLSVETPEQAAAADHLDVDYLGVSPIFPTQTKTDLLMAWGLQGLRLLRSRSRHRLIAIGGINSSNAAAVMEAGADGVAVVSAICSAPDPEASARELRTIVDRWRSRSRPPAF